MGSKGITLGLLVMAIAMTFSTVDQVFAGEQDITPPIITLLGADPQIIELGVGYTELGATAFDDIDGDISGNIVIDDSAFVDAVGSYIIIYDVTDSAGNSANPVERLVNVVDTIAPTFDVDGHITDYDTNVIFNGAYSVGIINNIVELDTPVSLIVDDDLVDTSVATTYFVTYTVTDASDNFLTITESVIIGLDTEKPVIAPNGASATVELQLTNSYSELDADVTDNDPNYVGIIVISGDSPDTSVVGVYTVFYNANADAGSNIPDQQSITITVEDTTLPIITANTIVNPFELTLTNEYTVGCTSADNDKLYVGICITTVGSIDTSVLGGQIIAYIANSDPSGNAPLDVFISTIVEDTTPPTILLIGSETPVLIKGIDTYVELGATVSDNNKLVNGNPVTDIGGAVVQDVLGLYEVTYDFTDPSLNVAEQVIRFVQVIAGGDPVITLIGDSEIVTELELVNSYIEQGATAFDAEDGDLTGSIEIGGDEVDTSILDTYIVTYDVVDSSMNNAEQVQRTITVQDTTKPIITLNIEPPFDANVVLIKGFDIYIEVGATISDNNKFLNGDPVNNIVSSINPNQIGVYIVTYNAVDPSGNIADQVIRIVSIVEGNPPVITLLGNDPVTVLFGSEYVDAGATCIDEEDGDLTNIFYEETSENGGMTFNVGLEDDSALIDTSNLDPQTVTYTCTDASMNVIILTRDVEIQKGGGGGGSCSNCQQPSIGVTERGTRVVDGGLTVNGQTVDAGFYHTEFPLIQANIGETITMQFKIWDDRKDNIAHVEVGLGKGKIGESFGNIEQSLIWNRHVITKIETVTHDPMFTNVQMTMIGKQPCKIGGTDCDVFRVQFTPTVAIVGDVVFGISIWDDNNNAVTTFFNDGMQIGTQDDVIIVDNSIPKVIKKQLRTDDGFGNIDKRYSEAFAMKLAWHNEQIEKKVIELGYVL